MPICPHANSALMGFRRVQPDTGPFSSAADVTGPAERISRLNDPKQDGCPSRCAQSESPAANFIFLDHPGSGVHRFR